jgi:hypothetical protein
MNKALPAINHETVRFTKHARERLDLRRLSEDMIIEVMRKPNTTRNIDDGKIKFTGKVMGANVHAICKPLIEENKWLVISLWVRGEDDAGKFTNRRIHRRKNRDDLSQLSIGLVSLFIFLALVAYYFLQSGSV